MSASIHNIDFADVDEDGLDEILVSNTSNCNYQESIPYSDTCTWLMVLDNDLNFLFEPIRFDNKLAGNRGYVLEGKGEKYIVDIYQKTRDSNLYFCAGLFDIRGELLKEQILDRIKLRGLIYLFFTHNNKIYLLYDNRLIYLDANLDF